MKPTDWYYNIGRGVYIMDADSYKIDKSKEVKSGYPNADHLLSSTKEASDWVTKKNNIRGRKKMDVTTDNTINVIENLPISEVRKIVSYFDSRPLTDEILEELGFVYEHNYNYVKIDNEPVDANWWLVTSVGELFGMKKHSDRHYIVRFMNNPRSAKFETVGSIKMLIEALKGERK